MSNDQLNKFAAFTLLAVGALTIMVGCVIVPGLSVIAQQLEIPFAAGWLVTLPSLGVVVFGPLAGRFIDRVGAYRALQTGLVFYGLLGASGALLTNAWIIVADRLLLGGATAIVMSAGTNLISSFYQGEHRLKMIALQGMSIELGGVIFLAIGGMLAALSWQYPFILYLFAWLLLLMTRWCIPNPHLSATVSNNELSQPSISPRLKWVYGAALMSLTCFFTAIIVLPQRLIELGINTQTTGYVLAFISLVAVFAAALMPKLVQRIGDGLTLVFAFGCYAGAHLIFAMSDTLPKFIAAGVLLGCGFGFSVPLVNHMTVEHSATNVRGRNLAYLSMAIFSGQFLASFMEYIPGTQSRIFLGAACLAIICCCSLALKRYRVQRHA